MAQRLSVYALAENLGSVPSTQMAHKSYTVCNFSSEDLMSSSVTHGSCTHVVHTLRYHVYRKHFI